MQKANHPDLHLAFVDYEEAYDSIEMWTVEKAIVTSE